MINSSLTWLALALSKVCFFSISLVCEAAETVEANVVLCLVTGGVKWFSIVDVDVLLVIKSKLKFCCHEDSGLTRSLSDWRSVYEHMIRFLTPRASNKQSPFLVWIHSPILAEKNTYFLSQRDCQQSSGCKRNSRSRQDVDYHWPIWWRGSCRSLIAKYVYFHYVWALSQFQKSQSSSRPENRILLGGKTSLLSYQIRKYLVCIVCLQLGKVLWMMWCE